MSSDTWGMVSGRMADIVNYPATRFIDERLFLDAAGQKKDERVASSRQEAADCVLSSLTRLSLVPRVSRALL